MRCDPVNLVPHRAFMFAILIYLYYYSPSMQNFTITFYWILCSNFLKNIYISVHVSFFEYCFLNFNIIWWILLLQNFIRFVILKLNNKSDFGIFVRIRDNERFWFLSYESPILLLINGIEIVIKLFNCTA